MDASSTSALWSAALAGLEDEIARVLDLHEALAASGVRSVDLLAASLLDGTWLDEQLALLRRIETLRRVLSAIEGRVDHGEYYDIDALTDAVTREIDARSRDEHLAGLLARLAPAQRAGTELFTCHVAGTTFRSLDRVLRADGSVAVEAAEDVLAAGAELRLEREPGNRRDYDAVRVLTLEERWLGYVPRAKTGAVATLLDAGLDVGAAVQHVERHASGWLEVRMTVSLFAAACVPATCSVVAEPRELRTGNRGEPSVVPAP